ncbi:MAG: hypothetical protein ACI9MC_001717 [Kiritimatiellia bacterium]
MHGDTIVSSSKLLRELYQRHYGVDEYTLILHQPGDFDAKGGASKALNLRYCVGERMGSHTATVVAAIAQ